MENPSPEANNQTNSLPDAEDLKPRAADVVVTPPPVGKGKKKSHNRNYRPSHKATFIGLAVVVIILAVNAGVFFFVLKGKGNKDNQAGKGQVVISPSVLTQLGVNRATVGDSGIVLQVAPDAKFQGKISVAGSTTLAGEVTLNSKLTGTNATFTQIQAGNTQLSQLNVNGDGTLSTLNLRKDLVVAGTSQFQGPIISGQLVTINNSLNVSGNVAIGGSLSVASFTARSLTSTSTLVVGGHIITGGVSPTVTGGSSGSGSPIGTNGNVSISGNDSAGAISINVGVSAGPSGGLIASVTFHNSYGSEPHIIITPVGNLNGFNGSFYITNLGLSGFSVADTGGSMAPGGYKIEYIVEQ